MSDEREQPEYGERATPEQQAEAIKASGGVPDWQRAAALPPTAPHQRENPLRGTIRSAAPRGRAQRGVASNEPVSSGYTINRFATIFLLGVGLVAVIQSFFGYLNLGNSIQTLYSQQGIGDYIETPLTTNIGIALVVVHTVVWAATAWISMRVLARGRMAWWIPLVGAFIAFIVTAILMATLLLADPAFIEYLGVGG